MSDHTKEVYIRLSNQDNSVSANQRSTSQFTVNLSDDPLVTHQRHLRLERFTYFNTIPTIYDSSYGVLQNNILQFSSNSGTSFQNVIIPSGKYNIDEFISTLNTITTAGVTGITATDSWSYDSILMRIKLKLPATVNPLGPYAVLGAFYGQNNTNVVGGTTEVGVNGAITTYPTARATNHVLPYIPDMSAGISELYLYVDPPIIRGLERDGSTAQHGALLDVIPVQGSRAEHVTYTYENGSPYFDILYANELRRITIKVLDKTGIPVNFGLLPVSVVLKINTWDEFRNL